MPTIDQMMSPEGCGAGTPNACFALALDGERSLHCLVEQGIKEQNFKLVAEVAVELAGRVNVDPEDNTICPSDDPFTKQVVDILSSRGELISKLATMQDES